MFSISDVGRYRRRTTPGFEHTHSAPFFGFRSASGPMLSQLPHRRPVSIRSICSAGVSSAKGFAPPRRRPPYCRAAVALPAGVPSPPVVAPLADVPAAVVDLEPASGESAASDAAVSGTFSAVASVGGRRSGFVGARAAAASVGAVSAAAVSAGAASAASASAGAAAASASAGAASAGRSTLPARRPPLRNRFRISVGNRRQLQPSAQPRSQPRSPAGGRRRNWQGNCPDQAEGKAVLKPISKSFYIVVPFFYPLQQSVYQKDRLS